MFHSIIHLLTDTLLYKPKTFHQQKPTTDGWEQERPRLGKFEINRLQKPSFDEKVVCNEISYRYSAEKSIQDGNCVHIRWSFLVIEVEIMNCWCKLMGLKTLRYIIVQRKHIILPSWAAKHEIQVAKYKYSRRCVGGKNDGDVVHISTAEPCRKRTILELWWAWTFDFQTRSLQLLQFPSILTQTL